MPAISGGCRTRSTDLADKSCLLPAPSGLDPGSLEVVRRLAIDLSLTVLPLPKTDRSLITA